MSTQNRLLRTAFLVGVGAALGGLAIYWLLRVLREEEETERAERVPSSRPEEYNIPIPLSPDLDEAELPALKTRRPAVERLAVPDDDLTRIDGIGPKYADGLHKLGISSFSALATQKSGELADSLKELGLRIIGDRIEAEDWVGQARLLAEEKS